MQHDLSGQFGFKVVNNDGSIDREINIECGFSNLLLDNFFTRLRSVGSPITAVYVQIGTGTSTPLVTDTALQSPTNSQSATSISSPTATLIESNTKIYALQRWSADFGFGTLVGNFTELGVRFDASSLTSTAHARTLIKDGLGNPTTLTLTAQQQLIVTYQLNLYIPVADVSGNTTISGTSYAWTCRPKQLGTLLSYLDLTNSGAGSGRVATSALLPVGDTTSPTGNVAFTTSTGTTFLDVNNGKDVEYQAGLSDANVSGGSFNWWGFKTNTNVSVDLWQMSFAPAIAKDNTKVVKLRVHKQFSRSA